MIDIPTKYRPKTPEAVADDTPDDWSDNALSNTLAWSSQKLTPSWCQTPEHWTSRTTDYLYTSCPCCLLFRGLVLGVAMTLVLATMIAATIIAVMPAVPL